MRLPELLDGVVGRSRIEAARQAERERCAGAIDAYRKELAGWTAADDHGQSIETQRAVAAVLLEAAKRVRARGDAPDHRTARPRANSARAPQRP